MTNAELTRKLESLVFSERKITRQIIELIQLADVRKLYLEQGYGSLFDWLTKRFQYSSSAAYRRLQAARLLSSLPTEQEEGLKEKIHSGSLNLTALSKVQSFIKEEEKRSGENVSAAVKIEILNRIENQPARTTEKILFQSFPEMSQRARQERVSALSERDFRVSVTLSEEALSKLKRVQELLGHALPESSLSEVIAYLSKEFLKRKDPLKTSGLAKPRRSAAVLRGGMGEPAQRRKISKRASLKSTEKSFERQRKPLPAQVRRFIFERDQGRCQFKSPVSGRLCGSRNRIEIDHIQPLALGGTETTENLRCLCRNHNQWRARVASLHPSVVRLKAIEHKV